MIAVMVALYNVEEVQWVAVVRPGNNSRQGTVSAFLYCRDSYTEWKQTNVPLHIVWSSISIVAAIYCDQIGRVVLCDLTS